MKSILCNFSLLNSLVATTVVGFVVVVVIEVVVGAKKFKN
jgi:hypothetical protein